MTKKIFLVLVMLLSVVGMAQAQTTKVTGKVLSEEDGNPVIGATVRVRGTDKGTATDINGEFTITHIPEKGKTLIISYVGMVTKEVALQPKVTVYMESSDKVLSEVVVTAYGTSTKSSLTGAITQLNKADIEKRPVTTGVSALEGRSTGVQFINNGTPGSAPTIRIRGVSTVNGDSDPLYVIDGVPFEGNQADVNPQDIESISVLKDAASCALYGNRGAAGVILITTKKGNSTDRVNMQLQVTQGIYGRATKDYDMMGVRDWMNYSRQEYRNEQSNWVLKTRAKDNTPNWKSGAELEQFASDNFIEAYAKMNIFNAADNELFDANGQLRNDISVLPQIAEDLDWMDQGTRSGYRQEYNLSGSAGGERHNTYFSVGYLDEKGYIKSLDFNRLSGRVNTNIQPTKWFKAGLSLSGTHQVYNRISTGNTTIKNPIYWNRNIAPIYPVHLHNLDDGSYVLDQNGNRIYDRGTEMTYRGKDGELRENEITRGQLTNRHVLEEYELDKQQTKRNTMQAIAYADIMFLKDFTFTVKGNMNLRDTKENDYDNAQVGDGRGSGGRLYVTEYMYKDWTLQELLNWNHKFGKHKVEALLGHEAYWYQSDYGYQYSNTEALPGKANLSNFSVMSKISGYKASYHTESYFARARYNYDDRYNLEVTYRRDGSSRFSREKRWGNFGSVGANWLISNEDFMKDYPWVEDLKLRANWGLVGNDRGAGNYPYMAFYSATATNASKGAWYISQLANPDIKWETGQSWDVALEGRLFGRWNLDIEYYNKTNKDLIFDVLNPLSAGATSLSSSESVITRNIGSIRNTGFEVNTDIDIYRNRDWKVNFQASATFNKNKVTKLPEQNKEGILDGTKKIVEGKDRYSFYLYNWAGVDQLTGQSLYELNLEDNALRLADGSYIGKVNADGTPADDATVLKLTDLSTKMSTLNGDEDEEIIGGVYDAIKIGDKYYTNKNTYAQKRFFGSSLPKVYGSFGLNVSYKSFELSTLFTYQLGGTGYDGIYAGLVGIGGSPYSSHIDTKNSWNGVPEGITLDSPASARICRTVNPMLSTTLSANNNSGTSSRWLISNDYLNFRNITLNYKFPKMLVKKLDLQSASCFISVDNLVCVTARKGYNPQQAMAGTQTNIADAPRIATFGINVKF